MNTAITSLVGSASLGNLSAASASAQRETAAGNFIEQLLGAKTTSETSATEAFDRPNGLIVQPQSPEEQSEARRLFREFSGKAIFGQMLATMRKSLDKSPYFHGGRTEEVFQEQLDHKMVEEMTKKSAERFLDPMFEQQTRQSQFQARA